MLFHYPLIILTIFNVFYTAKYSLQISFNNPFFLFFYKMAQILLDTNFIISCVKKKIDFFEQIEELFPGLKILIPLQVINELEKLSEKGKIRDKETAKLCLDILSKKREGDFEIIDLNIKSVDKGVLDYIKDNKTNKIILATLDRGLKEKIKKIRKQKIMFLTIRGKRVDIV